jgi:lysophospholipase L1-like esterase
MWLASLFALSLAANALALAAAGALIRKRGGLSYLKSLLAARGIVRDRQLENFQEAYRRMKGELFALHPAKPGDLVLIGDSQVENGPWAELFGDLGAKNRGIGGDTVPGVRVRLARDLGDRPARIVALVGINDLNAGRPVEAVLADYAGLLEELAARAPGARLLVHGLFHVDARRYGEATNARVRALNAGLAELAGARGADFYDPAERFEREGGLDPAYTHDGLHLNGAGYARWHAALAPRMGLAP